MKWLAAFLGVILFTLTTRADATLYGAWYTVLQTERNALKDAGGVSIFLRGDLETDSSGTARVAMTVDWRGTQIVLHGSWLRAGKGRISVLIAPTHPGDDSWRGTLYTSTGQCSGWWRMDTARGRFQARKQ